MRAIAEPKCDTHTIVPPNKVPENIIGSSLSNGLITILGQCTINVENVITFYIDYTNSSLRKEESLECYF